MSSLEIMAPALESKEFNELSLQAFTSFTSLADLEQASSTWVEKVHATLGLFSKLWSFQLENRETLFRSEVTPWHIGDVAVRISSLYFGLYMRNGSCDHLLAACSWLEGIIARGYFDLAHDSRGFPSQSEASLEGSMFRNRLKVYARFILGLLFLDRREESWNLLLEIEALVAIRLSPSDSGTDKGSSGQEAIGLMNEISRFLRADVGMPIPTSPGSRLIYRPNLRCPPPSLNNPLLSNHIRRLKDVVLVSHLDGQIKIDDLSLDSYRMMLSLEWREDRFLRPPLAEASDPNLAIMGTSQFPSQPAVDAPNRHYIHHKGTLEIIKLLSSLYTRVPIPSPSVSSSLPSGPDLVLLHIVGKGHWGGINLPNLPNPPSTSPPPLDGLTIDESKANRSPLSSYNPVRIPLGVFGSSPQCSSSSADPSALSLADLTETLMTPDDLFPLTRRRLLLIVDSDASSAFLSPTFVRGCSSFPPMCLLSPSHCPSAFLSAGKTGSIFTLGLTCPLMAFCLMMGEKRPIESVQILAQIEAEIEKGESRIAEALSGPLSSFSSPWAAAWEDVLTRRLLTRFTLLRSAFHLHVASKGRTDCQCICSPTLPSVVNPGSTLCKELIGLISRVIEGREKLFGL